MPPDDVRQAAGHHRRQAAVGEGIAQVKPDMGDMGWHHLGYQTGASLHLGQLALGLFQRGVGGGKFAVRGGQPFGIGQNLIGKLLRPGAQKRLLPLDVGNVGIDRHPAVLRQGRPFDRDRAPVRARPLHVMRLKRAGLFDADADRFFGIRHLAIFTAQDQIADGVFKGRAGAGQVVRQVEHLSVLAVADRKPEVAVKDRQRLLDQVQRGLC